MTEKTRTEEILEKLDQGLTELFNSEAYKNYLKTMSKFHNYSFNNTLLIAMQRPDASLVAGYTDWQRKFHRQVQQGEKGIYIIAPSPYKKEVEKEIKNPTTGKMELKKVEVTIPAYKAVAVFDVSQTDGEEIPTLVVNELIGEVENWERLKGVLTELSPVPVSYEKLTDGSKGYYSLTDKKIVIKEGMEQKQELKTLIHEVAHALLHDKDGSLIEGVEESKGIDSRTREVQAESVAYSVCQHLGIDTSEYSFGYIAGWSSGKDKKELKASMETIRKTTNHMMMGIEKSFMELKYMEQEKEEKKVEKKSEQKKPKTRKKVS